MPNPRCSDISIQAISLQLKQVPTLTSWHTKNRARSSWTIPDWPPSSNSDEDESPTVPGQTTTPIVPTVQPTEILPHPPTTITSNDDGQWKVISVVFITLTVILFLITIGLWIVIPKPKKSIYHGPITSGQKIYSIPRPQV